MTTLVLMRFLILFGLLLSKKLDRGSRSLVMYFFARREDSFLDESCYGKYGLLTILMNHALYDRNLSQYLYRNDKLYKSLFLFLFQS